MAAIYTQKDDEIHIYNHRIPKKDGSEPSLWWLPVLAVLFLVRFFFLATAVLGALFLDGFRDALWQDVTASPLPFVWDIIVLAALFTAIVTQFRKVVFSPGKKKIYRSFLFLRSVVGDFDDVADIMAVKDPAGGKYHYYVIAWRDKLRKPFRISPPSKTIDRLARYYYTVVPLLRHMPGLVNAPEAEAGADAVEAVAVETVEVPVE